MAIQHLRRQQDIQLSLAEAWDFFSQPANLDTITPPDLAFEIVSGADERMFAGQIITYRIGLFPGWRASWVTEITAVQEGAYFIDEQRFGPYAFWHHRHTFEALPGGGVRLGDILHYDVGKGWAGDLALHLFVRRRVESIFAYRARILAERFGEV